MNKDDIVRTLNNSIIGAVSALTVGCATLPDYYYSLSFSPDNPSGEYPMVLSQNQGATLKTLDVDNTLEIIIKATGKFEREIAVNYKNEKCESKVNLTYQGDLRLFGIEGYGTRNAPLNSVFLLKRCNYTGISYKESTQLIDKKDISSDKQFMKLLSENYGNLYFKSMGVNNNYATSVNREPNGRLIIQLFQFKEK